YQVVCCHQPTGGYCATGFSCIPQDGDYGACLPTRSSADTKACEALLKAGGGVACAAGGWDQDSVLNDVDPCACVPNADSDPDGDRIGEGCDTCPTTADPGQVDTDQDGLGDECDLDDDDDSVADE